VSNGIRNNERRKNRAGVRDGNRRNYRLEMCEVQDEEWGEEGEEGRQFKKEGQK